MTINENLTTMNYTAVGNIGRINYIVIHYTGNDGDTAKANTDYFKSVYRGASAHYFVDENSIWLCVADKDIAWHCGTSGTYKHAYCRNTNSIGIELCSRKNSSGAYYFKADTVTNAVWLTRMLINQYGVPVSNVVRHYDVTGKICPAPYIDSTAWSTFKAQLTDTKEETKEDDMTEEQVKAIADASAKAAIESYISEQEAKTASEWAKANWSEAVAAGVFDGTMPRSSLTREQAATVFYKMGLLDLSKDKDVSDWAKDAWEQAVSDGMLDGTNPRCPLTREQFSVVLKCMRQAEGQ